MPNDNVYNPQNFDIGVDSVTIGGVAYLVDSYNLSPTVNTVDSNDSEGAYRGSAWIKGKEGLSLNVRRATNTDELPAQFVAFTYRGKDWVLVNITESGNAGGERTYAIEASIKMFEE